MNAIAANIASNVGTGVVSGALSQVGNLFSPKADEAGKKPGILQRVGNVGKAALDGAKSSIAPTFSQALTPRGLGAPIGIA